MRDTSVVVNRRGVCTLFTAAAIITSCSGHPGRVHVLGRDYDRGGTGPMSLTAVHARFGPSVPVVSHGKLVAGTAGVYAPTVIFVKDGGGYYEYALSGGP